MGKSKRQRATVRTKPYDAKPVAAAITKKGDDAAMGIVAPTTNEPTESRGSIEKRQHDQLRKWKRHEEEIRRQMRKLSKKDQRQVQERKKLLTELKADKKAMEERHQAELTQKISPSAVEEEQADASVKEQVAKADDDDDTAMKAE